MSVSGMEKMYTNIYNREMGLKFTGYITCAKNFTNSVSKLGVFWTVRVWWGITIVGTFGDKFWLFLQLS